MKTLSAVALCVVAGLALNAAIKHPDWRAQLLLALLALLAFVFWAESILLFVRAGDVR